MMACFGASWPVSIAKALRCKRSEGKSVLFLAILLAGYAMGLAHKFSVGADAVTALYALNMAMVAADLGLCVHYRRHPGGAGRGAAAGARAAGKWGLRGRGEDGRMGGMNGFAGMLARGMARMPKGAASAAGRGLAWALGSVARIRRREVLATLARCFPEMPARERRAVYRGMWRNLAEGLVEVCRYAGGRTREVLDAREVRGRERVAEALASGKGVIALLAHVGNYPLLAADVPRLFGVELSFVYKPFRNAWATRAWREFQEGAGVEGIPAKGAYRASLKALRSGRVLGFMLDQNRPNGQGVFVPFFGRPASTSPGLALLSHQSGAVVLPVFEHREGGRHVVEIGAPIEAPPDRGEATLAAYTARYTALIEAEIRRHPAEWLWLHRRWKTRPPEERG